MSKMVIQRSDLPTAAENLQEAPVDATNFGELEAEMLGNADVRAAYQENSLRRELGAVCDRARTEQGYSVQELAKRMGTSVQQVQRLLHREVGGVLHLGTLCRAADVLGLRLRVDVTVKERIEKP